MDGSRSTGEGGWLEAPEIDPYQQLLPPLSVGRRKELLSHPSIPLSFSLSLLLPFLSDSIQPRPTPFQVGAKVGYQGSANRTKMTSTRGVLVLVSDLYSPDIIRRDPHKVNIHSSKIISASEFTEINSAIYTSRSRTSNFFPTPVSRAGASRIYY